MALTLYIDRFWISPYAFSNFVALEEKKIPYTLKEIGLDKKDHYDPSYRKNSLTGRIPAIDHDGFWLTESNAIDDYLEDAFPPEKHPRLFPKDVRERGRARQLMAWVRSDLMPIREERATHTMFYEKAKSPLTEKGKAAAETLVQAADLIIPEERPHPSAQHIRVFVLAVMAMQWGSKRVRCYRMMDDGKPLPGIGPVDLPMDAEPTHVEQPTRIMRNDPG